MSEPIQKLPKPFSKTSYVLLTTLWAFLLPGLICNGLPLALIVFTSAVNFARHNRDMGYVPLGERNFVIPAKAGIRM